MGTFDFFERSSMEKSKIKELSILELLKNFRIIKRQIRIIRAMNISEDERHKLNKAVTELENDLKLFKI